MTAYHLIGMAFVVMTLGSYFSYDQSSKERWWFTPLVISFGIVNYWLWSIAARWTTDKRELYTVSTFWDLATLVSYNLIPLLIFGVRLSPTAWFGFALVCVGALLVKTG